MKNLILFLFILNCCCTTENTTSRVVQDNKTQVLLIGTSHFQTFDPSKNYDISQVQQIDVLTPQSQTELAEITNKIIEFGPNKIFVERSLSEQNKLDSDYKSFDQTDFSKVKRDELEQIAFRCAKKMSHQKVYAMDYKDSNFPYYSMIESMEKSGQTDLLNYNNNRRKTYEDKYNSLVNETGSVKEILFYLNSKEYDKHTLSFYFAISNAAGTLQDEVGSLLTSEWYKRNIYMLSNIQKQTEKNDKIMILAGASHVTVWRDMIKYIPDWEIVELKQIMD